MKPLLMLILLATTAHADWMTRDGGKTRQEVTPEAWKSGQPGLTVKGWRLTTPPEPPTSEEVAAVEAAADVATYGTADKAAIARIQARQAAQPLLLELLGLQLELDASPDDKGLEAERDAARAKYLAAVREK